MIDNIRKLVRPFMAVSFVAAAITLAMIGKIEAKEILSIASIIVAFYFGERSALKKPGSEQ